VLPGPGDVPGGLWEDDRSLWSSQVDNAVYDLCDDAQAFAVAMGRFLEPGEEITPFQRTEIAEERQLVRCGVAGGDRYVYIGENFRSTIKPTKQEALDDPWVQSYLRKLKNFPPGRALGYVGIGSSVHDGRINWDESDYADEVRLVAETVSVVGGTVRGLVKNRSKALFARNVTVTVQESGGKSGSAIGGWPLTIQPDEDAPFEVAGWTGSTDPQKLDINIAADMSPLVDLSRSFEIEPYLVWQGKIMLYEDDYRGLFPAQVINTQDQKIPAEKFDAVTGVAQIQWPDSHPSLEEKTRSQTFDDLRTYVAFFDDDRRVTKILQLVTHRYTYDGPDDPGTIVVGAVTSHVSFRFNFIAETLNFAIYVGNANKPQK